VPDLDLLPKGNTIVGPEDLLNIPVGSIIHVGKKLEPAARTGDFEASSVWFVFAPGKAVVIDSAYPDSETEDPDWFKPWQVIIVGFNLEYF